MLKHRHADLTYFTFESFPNGRLVHAVFGRQGGVSPAPFDSLNMSTSTGDSKANVHENLRRAYAALRTPVATMVNSWQVHGADAVVVDRAAPPTKQGDALITDRVGNVSLFLGFADCVPLFLYDPVRHVIGLAHAGWRGTVTGVAQSAVRAMSTAYGCRPGNILAGIGPSIGPARYAVGPDVVAAVQQAFPDPDELIEVRAGQAYFDLWAANARALQASGVREIEVARLCTATHRETFFSHRGDDGRSGRFGAIIALRQ